MESTLLSTMSNTMDLTRDTPPPTMRLDIPVHLKPELLPAPTDSVAALITFAHLPSIASLVPDKA